MKRWSVALASACLLVSVLACSSSDSSSHDRNVIKGTTTEGASVVVAITAYDSNLDEDADLVYDAEYDDNLAVDCSYSWTAQGTLCDESPTTDSKTASTKSEPDSGATWYATDSYEGRSTGVLVIDACSDLSCTTASFDEARVFQMFSDGKTTLIRLAVHDEVGDTPPAWNDPGWTVVTDDFEPVGPGDDIADDGTTVESPAVLSLGSQHSRYVRVEAQNLGDYDDGEYIELRAVKLF